MKKFYVVLYAVCLFLTSCKKETVQTETTGDQVTLQLQKVINENYIKRVYPVKYNDVLPNSYPVESGTTWKFSNGFIEVNYGLNHTYHLLYLHHYSIHQVQLDNNTSEKALLLYF